MNEEAAKKLREPFPAEAVGKLPRVTCPACREAQAKHCGQHQKQRCRECSNWITTAHIHLDYVGHAEVTDRLLSVDADWTWEPLAFDNIGLPAFDQIGGMWIKLTVAGVTRLGYGNADGKKGGDAIKEVIGDAIKNAAMRQGVALDLWGVHSPAEVEPEPAAADGEGRTHGSNGSGEPPPDTASAARAVLATRAKARNVSLDVVSAAYQRINSRDLATETDPAYVRQFIARLDADPDGVLGEAVPAP